MSELKNDPDEGLDAQTSVATGEAESHFHRFHR